MSSIGELTFFLRLQVQHKEDGIFISQDKYVADILKKFNFVTIKTASTPIETNKALLKDKKDEDVDVHLYRSMIGSLMYLIASRTDIMFTVYACARFQVTLKVSHIYVVKRIFRYLKGQPKLGLWYPRDSPFNLEAFYDSDYAGASLNRKSTTGAEYVAATNCYGQVLWIQNQMLDYGFNFMNTNIYIDNESIICIVKNPVFDSKTKHIEIRIEENAEFHQIVDFPTTSSIHYALTQIHAIVDGKTVVVSESSVRSDLHFNDEDGITCLTNTPIFENLALMGQALQKDTQLPQTSVPIPNVADEAVFKERDDRVVRAITTAASLDATHASSNRPRWQESMRGAIAQTRSERASKHSYDSPLLTVNTPRSDEEMNEQQDLTDFVPPTPHNPPLSGGHTPESDE
ncbi:hypothetical protein Tco_1426413, partial [Tanacetum coccineum]